MHAQHNDLRVRATRFDLPDRVDTVQLRHRNISDDYIRSQGVNSVQKSKSIMDNADQVERVLKQGLQALCNDRVVVGEKNFRLRHQVSPSPTMVPLRRSECSRVFEYYAKGKFHPSRLSK